MRRPIAFLVALAAGAAALTGAGTGVASAARGTVVVMGDSFAANSPDLQGCAPGTSSWPKRLSAKGYRVIDVSCSGASLRASSGGYVMGDEAAKAQRRGGFTSSTKAVLLQFGMNDKWGSSSTGLNFISRCVTNGCGAHDRHFRGLTGAVFAAALKPMVDYIRYYSPKASITVVGYPEIIPSGVRNPCVDVVGLPLTRPAASGVSVFLDRLQTAQRDAATRLGIGFADLRAATRGHGLCSSAPYMNGVANPRADLFGIPLHPTARGDAVAARVVARQI